MRKKKKPGDHEPCPEWTLHALRTPEIVKILADNDNPAILVTTHASKCDRFSGVYEEAKRLLPYFRTAREIKERYMFNI